jgi:TonB family protein
MKRRIACFALLSSALLVMDAGVCAQQVGSQDMTHPASTNSSSPPAAKSVEILSDTQGVDFGPYLSKEVPRIRTHWYQYIPEEARPPELKSGETVIEFAILKDGRVAGMRIVHPAPSQLIDRAAWGGITASVPFPPLPKEFKGQFLALRMHFVYNPAKQDKPGQSAPVPADSEEPTPAPH